MRLGKPKTVFARAFLVLVLSGLVIQGVMVAAMISLSPTPSPSKMLFANLDLYLRLLSERVAQNPSPEQMENLLRDTRFDIRVSGGMNWSTRGATAAPREIAQQPGPGGHIMTFEDGRPVFRQPISTPKGPAVVTFLGPQRPPAESPPVRFALFGGILLTVFVVASLAVRRILQPLSVLSRAFEEVRSGRIQTSVPVSGEDELSRLSRSFNDMAAGIRFLIKDKEQLFTELSHEFRAPIARVFAANALIEDAELQTQIASDLKELDGLIHAQMTAARLEAGSASAPIETIELDDLLEEVVRLFPGAQSRLALQAAPAPVTCQGDSRSLRTLFRNLVENALKYSPGEKPVRIGAEMRDETAVVFVADQGLGISEGEQARLFEPFYRGNDREKVRKAGFGLGLALCQRIVKAHGGELRVGSSVGKGTTIEVALPVTLRLPELDPKT